MTTLDVGRVVLSYFWLGLLFTVAHSGYIASAQDLGSKEIVWSAQTNGVSAGFYLDTNRPTRINLFLRTEGGFDASHSRTLVKGKPASWIWGRYFAPTNPLCGPLELRDAAGNQLSPNSKDVQALTAYPSSYSLEAVRWTYLKAVSSYSGPGFPPRSVSSGPLPSFDISNYFALDHRKIYQLVIWPKVYRRTSTGSDLCQRIDLPPLRITVKNP